MSLAGGVRAECMPKPGDLAAAMQISACSRAVWKTTLADEAYRAVTCR